jgi:hypothetical protein
MEFIVSNLYVRSVVVGVLYMPVRPEYREIVDTRG